MAHRPSTVLLADRVALLADGRIAAVGTHSELLATVPEYRNLLAQTSPSCEGGSDDDIAERQRAGRQRAERSTMSTARLDAEPTR